MRQIYVTLAAASIIGFIGCNKSTPGGPGVSESPTNGKKPIIGQEEKTFTLATPTLSTRMKQGETKEVTISINRGKNMDDDVQLKFEDLPKSLTIEPMNAAIKHDDTEAKITLKAADDASVGDFTIKVTGHPTKGADAMSELKVTIAKK